MTTVPDEVTEFQPDGGVVVGDDGSECASAAVVAAAEEAVRRGVWLHVVRAWSIMTAVRPPDLPRGVVPSVVEFQEATVAADRERVAALLDGSPAEVEVHAVHAAPAKALIHASETADLLVVGTRGLDGFRHLLLGSVAEQCVRYASCSVLVARDRA